MAVARILTEDFGTLLPPLTGFAEPVQAILVQLSEAGMETRHLVVNTHSPEVERGLLEEATVRLKDYFGRALISFWVKDKPGRAVIYIPTIERGRCSVISVAMAVAVIKRSWGWDESKWIIVGFEVSREVVKMSPEFDGGEWRIGGKL